MTEPGAGITGVGKLGQRYDRLSICEALLRNSFAGDGSDLLSGILVPAPSVLKFCKDTKIFPPPAVLSGAKRLYWKLFFKPSHLSPPESPAGRENLVCERWRQAVTQRLNAMEHRLGVVLGTASPDRLFGRIRPAVLDITDAEAWEHHVVRWQSDKTAAEDALQNIHAPDLGTKLENLIRDWQAARPAPSISPTGHANSFDLGDEPLLEEMKGLISSGKASSPYNAGLAVADKATGSGTADSKAKRLSTKYNRRFGH
jgi:hypothetical protein